ncbi:MAG: SPFH domain-containing protein [Hyphomicrobiaceae bacterium]
MLGATIGILAFIAGIVLLVWRRGATPPQTPGTGRLGGLTQLMNSRFGSLALIVAGLFLIAQTSYVFIDADRVGHLKRVYGFSELPPGRIIGLSGEKGPQAKILGPGFHFIPLVRVLYEVEEYDVVVIPQGQYGELTALDGLPMPAGMFIAPQIADDQVESMLTAETFLTKGGYRGPQETVLKPGSYRLNRYLFRVTSTQEATPATIIPAGSVGVVKSNVSRPGAHCVEEEVKAAEARGLEGALSVPLVPTGCVGIWRDALLPGAYYLNRRAYEVTLVDTRVQTWDFKGGFIKRLIDLSVDQQGNIRQTERTEPHPEIRDAADRAVFLKVEGWDIPQELRVLVQVSPKNAPVVVGAVGGLDEVRDRILIPVIRSIVRNVAGSEIVVPDPADTTKTIRRRTHAIDLIENRDAIERTIEALVKREGLKAGVDIQQIRLGEPAIPPELLISRQREQLAQQLAIAYQRETESQAKRIETEQARATANEQPRLVESQIAVQVAQQREAERAALGRAERQYLEELARGQLAQANVLGQDRVAMLQALDKTLVTLERKPELVSLISRLVPNTVVTSGGSGLEGAAAILGNAMRASAPQPAPQPVAQPQ